MAAESPSDDLDELLDSALDDFSKLDLASKAARIDVVGRGGGGGADPPARAPPSVQGLGMGLPDLRTKRKGKLCAPPPRLPAKGSSSHASEALEKLTQQTREAVRGLETAAASPGPWNGAQASEVEGMVDEFVKQFEELGGSQDMQSVVETMMKQLLSKEILHEPMKEIAERYPKWLEDRKDGLNEEEHGRYKSQYELILKLNDVYEHDPNNFTAIVDLMQKMQECGHPPSEIVQELAPGIDLSNMGQLSPEMLESNCCVM